MVTGGVMDAIDILIELCSNEEQAKGMRAVREMLADFDEAEWLDTERPSDCYDWLEQYLSCQRNTEGEIKQNRIIQAKALWQEFGDIPMNPETELRRISMYKEPKNSYETAMNEVYEESEKCINNGTFLGLEPITANLEVIYNRLPYGLQMELGDNFYQLFCLTDTEEDEEY